MPRAAIIGNLTYDVVAGTAPRIGGMVYYCARALQRISPDADVVLACRCAPEDRDTLLPQVERLGFPVTWHPAERTTRFAFHYEGDRRIMEVQEIADPWTPEDTGRIETVIAGASWVIVGALLRTDFPLETLAALTGYGHRLALDAQGLVRHGATGPLRTDGDIDRRVLEHVAALKLNDEEAVPLCGGTDEAALRTLGVPEVILTKGSAGALLLSGEQTVHVDAVPVTGPVDPTGAGDTFLLAYGHAREHGATVEAAGNAASRIVSQLIAR